VEDHVDVRPDARYPQELRRRHADAVPRGILRDLPRVCSLDLQGYARSLLHADLQQVM
jgi:hypothetical protein